MEKKSFKKLELKKQVVARLDKSEMEQIVGGALVTINVTCGAQCFSAAGCNPQAVTIDNCQSFRDGPTCRGTVCGSDTKHGCPNGGYSVAICSGTPVATGDWHCSVCVC